MKKLGIVIIGRNEGDKLKVCLNRCKTYTEKIVYVDSGSTDDSVDFAKSLGIDIIELDLSVPFSAGRARNSGYFHLQENYTELEYTQFIDGDCELENNWLVQGISFLDKETHYAIVAGRVRERFPDASIYNRLCDLEWDTPTGEVEECGGIFMIRNSAFQEIKGFNPSVIAGEEPDLCYRLTKAKWKIYRLSDPMVLHDAQLAKFSQWKRRAIRSGHAYAQGYYLHREEKDGYCLKDSQKIWFWAFLYPLFIFLTVIFFDIKALILFVLYILQFVKITGNCHKWTGSLKQSVLYSFFTILGRWPQLAGQIIFLKRLLKGESWRIIERKK